MHVIVTTETDSFTVEVSEELELENFKVLCEVESGIASADIIVVYNGRRLTDDKKSLKEYGVKDGELMMVLSASSFMRRAAERMMQTQRSSAEPQSVNQIDFGAIQVPGSSSGRTSNAQTGPRSSVSPSNAASLQGGQDVCRSQNGGDGTCDGGGGEPDDLGLGESAGGDHFAKVLREQQEARRDRERQRIRLISADPFDMEAQKMIAEEIQQENINANMEAAMEFNPESFGTVHMLYINCFVNGHPVKAFIDSGAQTTIMSQSCAERCNIMRLVDTRWAGIAKGVGTQKIIGRVHMGQIQIEGDFLASSFSILEEQPMDMLLGLDMLKRHQMSIDLKENQLIIGTTNTKTRFLNESELPECARLTPPGAMTEEDILRQSERKARMDEDEALAKALADSAQETSNKSLKNDVNSKPHRTEPRWR
ncbi:Protein DDI1-like protein 2 [Armadillidium nasatum]|uniref:Protein DDI1-like protein 2 n=1 Tax=Armadillidium nasatum TaxID=96803 RepID=A0A5N5TB69_9CRUS|nr:Protein DDI1-like protein 2 [Armadillidium nasatum]